MHQPQQNPNFNPTHVDVSRELLRTRNNAARLEQLKREFQVQQGEFAELLELAGVAPEAVSASIASLPAADEASGEAVACIPSLSAPTALYAIRG